MNPRTRRRILLHVGSPKCGSTFLQLILLRNAALLREHGIFYPHDGGGHPGNAAQINTLERPTYDALFADGMHTVVLSHEDLYSVLGRGRQLAKFAQEDGAEVELLAFLRPFSEFVFGDYSQFMKQFFDIFLQSRNPYNGQSFDEFAVRRVKSLTPAIFLRNWCICLDGARITVDSHRAIKPVLSRLLGPDIPLDWELPHHQTNPSLRMVDCDRIAAAMHDPDMSDAAIRALFQDAFHRTANPDPGRSEARTQLIEAAFAPQNKALLDMFGYDNRLPGYPLPA